MIKSNKNAPATKADVARICTQIDRMGKQSEKRWKLSQKHWDAQQKFREEHDLRWKENNAYWNTLEKSLKKRAMVVDHKFEDIRLFFTISIENMYHDFRGAFDDRTLQYKEEVLDLKKRIGAIERRLRFSRR